MFRHKGKNRAFKHNLHLASILSLIAGMVNIVGVLSVKTLTTNVTGHFAFFAEELVNDNYTNAFIFLIYILCFLIGAFVSNMLIEIFSRIKPQISHAIPMIIEVLILTIIATFSSSSTISNFTNQLIACALLFSMGIQNSLVTKVSQSVVRTTHLTGLFTDLGIELSQLFFYKQKIEFQKLSRSIYLKLAIISFFFIGCIIGGFLFLSIQLKTFFITSICLMMALLYDNIRYYFYHVKRKLINNELAQK